MEIKASLASQTCLHLITMAFPFCPQGAEAVDRRGARGGVAAALKDRAAPSAGGRNPPLAGSEKAETLAPAAAANQNTPPAAA